MGCRWATTLAAAFAALLLITTHAAATRVDTTFTASDGVVLSVAYYRPTAAPPSGGFPAILLIHGFAGSRDVAPGSYGPLYADSGYFCVAYSVRGQGRPNQATMSGGFTNWITGDRELRDAHEILAWMRARGDVDTSRIAAEGISQGGLTAWGLAATGAPLRCIVPMIAVPHYSRSFTFNGCTNYGMMLLLYTARSLNLVNMGPLLGDTVYNDLANDRYEHLHTTLLPYDFEQAIARLATPVFMQCAWHDELFAPEEPLRAFRALQGARKLLLFNAGHALPVDSATAALRFAQTLRFYRYWLKDDTRETIMAPDSAVALYDNGTQLLRWLSIAQLDQFTPPELPAERAGTRLFLAPGGQLTESADHGPLVLAATYIKDVTNDGYGFTSQPLAQPLLLVGARAHLTVSSSGRNYQANVLLYDVDSAGAAKPICRGAYQVRLGNAEPRTPRTINYDLAPQLYSVPRGHRIRAILKFGMPGGVLALQRPAGEFGRSAYAPQETANDTLFSVPGNGAAPEAQSCLTLYTANTGPASVAGPAAPALPTRLVVPGSPVAAGHTLHIPIGDEPARIDITDLAGRIVLAVPGAVGEAVVQTDGLAAGAYFIRAVRATGIAVGRFVVIR